jgi:hypothetical protein
MILLFVVVEENRRRAGRSLFFVLIGVTAVLCDGVVVVVEQ